MKRKGNRKKGRNISILLRRSPWGTLLQKLSVSFFLLTGSILLLVLLGSPSCSGGDLETEKDAVEEHLADKGQEQDSEQKQEREQEQKLCVVRIKADEKHCHIREIEYFLFNSEGTRRLVAYADGRGFIKLPAGEYDLVVIANSQGKVDTTVVTRYDVMEFLTCRFESEDPLYPMCSEELHLDIVKDTTLHTEPLPMVSAVRLVKIENNIEGNARIENPYVYLVNINNQTEILRHDGFRATEYLKKGEISYLDDIGIYPAYPDAELRCYPNDCSENIPGMQSTGIVLECEICKEKCRMEASLPPLGRNVNIFANLRIDSSREYEWEFNVGSAPG